jgi:CHAD domain-containing protein
MVQEHIRSYIGKQIEDLTAHLQTAGQAQSTDAVHDTRVCIKRIRAFLKVLDLKRKNRAVRRLLKKELGAVFKAAGRLRDTEVQLSLLKDYENLLDQHYSFLEKRLDEKIGNSRRKLREIVSERKEGFLLNLHQEIINETDGLADKNIIRSIRDFLVSAIEKNKKNSQRFTPKALHKQRVLLKEIRFCLEMTNDMIPELHADVQIPAIKEMEDILGGWHDYTILSKTVEKQMQKLSITEADNVDKMNLLANTISNDIILLLDKYRKSAPHLKLKS